MTVTSKAKQVFEKDKIQLSNNKTQQREDKEDTSTRNRQQSKTESPYGDPYEESKLRDEEDEEQKLQAKRKKNKVSKSLNRSRNKLITDKWDQMEGTTYIRTEGSGKSILEI